MGEHSTHHGVFGVENDNAEHHRWQTQCLRPKKQNATCSLGIRQHHQEPVSAGLHRFPATPTERSAGTESRRELPSATKSCCLCHFGKLRFKSEQEQQIWGECSRLITNCIIFYNATLLSRLLEHSESGGDNEAAELLKLVSPVAWQHINFYGRYEFSKQPAAINLEEIVEQLVRIRFESELRPTA